MTVTEVFEHMKFTVPVDHILSSRSAEVLTTNYRKLLRDGKCPPLRGSLKAEKRGGQTKKKSGFGEDVVAGKRIVDAGAESRAVKMDGPIRFGPAHSDFGLRRAGLKKPG
jgi:hypothetical protein